MRTPITALLAGCSLAAIASQAIAETQESRGPAAANPPVVTEVIVTAGKRSELLQGVPVTVTVVGQDQVAQQNITDAIGLSRAVPALSAGVDQLRIRGIGTFSFARSSEASVGVVLDGVALANAGPVGPQLFDIARVEVLAGPQGTLFGRNASAGVLNIVTNAPDPSEATASAHVDLGSRNDRLAQLMGNLPLGPDAALRVTGAYVRQPQTIHDLADGSWDRNEARDIRARLLWRPTDDLKFNLIADYSRATTRGGGEWAVYASTPGSQLTNALTACGVVVGRDNAQSCNDGPNFSTTRTWGVSGQADWSVAGLTLTSITAYRGYDSNAGGDADSTPLDVLDVNTAQSRIRNVSQELRVTSPGGQLIDYVAGLYFFDSDQTYGGDQAGTVGFVPPPLILGQSFATTAHSRSYAAFGQATLHAGSRLRFIAGLRLNRDEVSASTTRALHPGAIAPFSSLAPVAASARDDSVSYRLGAQYDVAPWAMAYLTYNRGYKGPAINDQAASPSIPLVVRPEIPKAWELGLKTNLLDRRLAVDVALFHTHATDFQTQYYDPSIPGYVFGNAPSLTTKGVQVDVFGRLTDRLSVNGGAIYTDATYGAGYLVACSQGQTAALGCFAVPGGTAQDAAGTPLAGVPKFKLTANVEYRHPVGERLEGFVQADLVYSSRTFYGQGYDPLNSTGAHTVLGARIGVRTPDRRFGVAVFVRNLTDERVPNLTFAQPLAAQMGDPSAYVQFFGAESFRVVGVSLDGRF